MSVLEKLKDNNEYPIVFVGSGISKRYLAGFPSWEELLERFWGLLKKDIDFYGQLNLIKDESHYAELIIEKEKDFLSNIAISSIINKEYSDLFNRGEITIEDFSTRAAYKSGILPFKKGIANEFSQYDLIKGMEKEYESFQKMLTKTQILMTTNYDTLIEDSYNKVSQYGVKKYIGQKGFFEDSFGYAELYKLHGCVTDPKSIVITKEDYDVFNNNSVLISAKIISMLIYSPIIFFGYSLSDLNVRKFIKNFSSSLTNDDPIDLEERLILVEWKKDEDDLLEEVVYDQDLGCKFTVIRTDNYQSVYDTLSKIDQGVAPSEIRKYQSLIKKLVVDTGKEGALKSVLLSPVELDEIEKVLTGRSLLNQKIVVALGDSKVIFDMPNKLTYLEDYIFEKNELNTNVILRFLANEPINGRLPFIKYVSEEKIDSSNLHDYEKEKLRQRLENHGDLANQLEKISNSYKNKENDIDKIISGDHVQDRAYCQIAYNIEIIDPSKVEEYVKTEVRKLIDRGEARINTHLRRLLLIYDLMKNKKM